MIGNIFAGFLANLLFAIFLIAIGWLIYLITERRRLLRFFNIADTKRLAIYLSNLRVIPGGALGIDNINRNYYGHAVVYNEQLYATRFKERFNYLVPSLSESPTFLSKIVFADINVSIIPSPLSESEIGANSSIMSFGSPGYNKASTMIENNSHSVVRFINDNRAIQVRNVPNITDTSNAVIQRLVIDTTECKRSLFYVAGISERGTIGAANYLLKYWKTLNRKYKYDESFVVVINFPTDNYNNFTIALERKIE